MIRSPTLARLPALVLHESIRRGEETIREVENLIKKMDELGIDSFGDD
jgi:hypothetical protein